MGSFFGVSKPYEDINIIKDASGASQTTADGDQLGYKGVRASEQMARTDLERMKKYKTIIIKVGVKYEIDPALIAGIISRESRAGAGLDNGWGDNRKAWGLMQVDRTDDGGKNVPEGAWDSEEHLCQGTGELVKKIVSIRDKFKKWSEAQVLKGGIAAYNAGEGRIKSYAAVDKYTTGGDYSNDVVARAQWYKKNLFPKPSWFGIF